MCYVSYYFIICEITCEQTVWLPEVYEIFLILLGEPKSKEIQNHHTFTFCLMSKF